MFEKWNPDENCIPGKTRDTSYDAFLSKLTRGHELVAVSSKIKHHEDFGPFYRIAMTLCLKCFEEHLNMVLLPRMTLAC